MEIAIFSPSSLFFEEDDDDNDNHIHTRVEENAETQETYVERKHQFPGMNGWFSTDHALKDGVPLSWGDYDDQEIMENIAHNCSANDLPVIPHIKHTWGDKFPNSDPDWDLIIANVKQYPNLIQTISFLLKSYKHGDKTKVSPIANDETHGDVVLPWPAFLMSWRRRIGKEDESIFFGGCEKAGLEVKHIGSRVYCISLIGNEKSNKCLMKEDS
ncbi:hypothetical protein TSUD_263270 [Trifolium subterraneum]|uniref:Uncharacterized protein n=1 Tax=Trifolium subterraneum TaxID=3900 RepID=A0A2Z6NWE1_TRISU|nr:hypothetical protein TSUD_263270 [Trifolium subterraneum]